MITLDWDPELETGIARFDAEHRRIFTLFNELVVARRRDEPSAGLASRLDALVAAVEEHFASEEELMAEIAYPGLAAHSEEHHDLLQRVRRFQAAVREGRQAITLPVLQYLSKWLTTHVHGADRDHARLLRSLGAEAATVGAAPSV